MNNGAELLSTISLTTFVSGFGSLRPASVRFCNAADCRWHHPADGLCCLRKRFQYKISKSKFTISMMAVTPATESTNASLSSW
jgi:hypothetical protein